MKNGKVYLVGAGPGDPGLLTKKGGDCLAQADVVIYDHLLDEELLDLAPQEAERIYVGKSGAEHAKEQDEINRLLVEKASGDKIVVRLKGGDPFVFGRGAEEAEVLARYRISFEIVPGVSSAIAVPAYAGISVTHRGLASSFAVITGHEDPSKADSSINWGKLATGVDTLVFLMGMGNLPEIVAKLIEYGRSPDTPIAVIKDGTRPEQKTVVSTLKNITDELGKNPLEPPAVIVVGEVVKLREKLRWFDNRPLFGKRILITRAHHQAGALSKLFAGRGAKPIEQPVIAIQAIADTGEINRAIMNLGSYQWVVFTSVNGVSAFFTNLNNLGLDSRALYHVKIGAIGPATARALKTSGIVPDYVPEVYTSQGFIAGLRKWDIAGEKFLLLRADIADEELTRGINELQAEVRETAAYRTVFVTDIRPQVKEMLLSGEINVITFTSASTVSGLLAMLKKERIALKRIKIACIGPKTAEAAASAGLKVDIVAGEYTMAGMVAAVEEYFRKEN